MANLCAHCGWTLSDLELVDLDDAPLLVCRECAPVVTSR